MITAICPHCHNEFGLFMPLAVGQRVTCSVCKTYLEIIWLFPVSLDMIENQKQSTEQNTDNTGLSTEVDLLS